MIKGIPKKLERKCWLRLVLGKKIASLATQHGISNRTIYGWFRKDASEDVVSPLRYKKLKRENQELKRLIGELTLDISLGKN